jgi:phosphoglucosamine mutase
MKYFGTDGIRGKALEKLTPELAFRMGQSLKKVLNADMIVIGGDTRQSSDLLGYSIANGAMLAGIHVLYAGVVSTPMLAHYAKVKKIVGVMITASHNPFTDNGIKTFYKEAKLDVEVETQIEAFIDSDEVIKAPQYGTFQFTTDMDDIYLALYDNINLKQTNLKIGYDSANGANYKIAKKVFDLIAPNAFQIGNTPDGSNINKGVGSMHLESIQSLVIKENLDLGFAFDGDADRMNLVDQEKEYDGDFVVYMIGKYLKSKGMLPNNKVVLTKMSNPGMLKALKEAGIEYVLTDVGDKYVLDAMKQENLVVGGEASGHIILTHLIHTGDGLLAAVYLLSILSELKTTPKAYTREVTLYPLKTINIKNVDKASAKNPKVLRAVRKAEALLGEDYLLLLRPSGTEPVVRLTCSHKDEALVLSVMDDIKKVIEEVNQ